MLLRLIRAERMNSVRLYGLLLALMPIISAVLGTINYLGNIEILDSEWYSLWTQHTIFTSTDMMAYILCPYYAASSRQTWLNKTLTMPVPKSEIFLAKLITVTFMILISEIWIGALLVISGKIIGMTAALPFKDIMIWCLFGTLGGMVMAAVQLVISMFIKSFALPIGISLVGGISGLVFLAKNLGHIWPYSLMAYGMNSNSPQQMLESGYIQFVLICIVYIAIVFHSRQYTYVKKRIIK